MARRILGIDLGSRTIKAALFNQTFRGLELEQLRVLQAPEPEDLAEELAGFVSTHDLTAETVITSLPGDQVSTRVLTLPFKDRRRIGPAVPFAVEDQVPFELDGFVMDWQLLRSEGTGSQVGATLAPLEQIRSVVSALSAAGLEPRIIEPEGLVLGHLARLFELEGPRLLLDVGHRKSTLCLCLDGKAVAARSVPGAGLAFTEAIAKERNVPIGEAEAEKLADGIFGGSGRRESPKAIAVAERMAREVLRTLGSAGPEFGSDSGLRILLCGGSAHLHRFDEFLGEHARVPTERLALPQSDLATAVTTNGDPLLFAPALALAARAAAPASSGMNLRKDDLAPRFDMRKVGRESGVTLGLFLLTCVLFLVGVGVDAAIQGRRADEVEARSRALYEQAFPGRPAPSNLLAGMQQAVSDAQRRADTLGVYRGNLSALDLLAEVSAHVPKDLDVVFEELVIERSTVQVKGHSPSFGSVDRLKVALSKYAPFSEIAVGDITRDSRRGGQNFSVRISLSQSEES